jgi:hypothetical protein
MENVTEWQHPFVDVFKKYNTFDAPKAFKGSVTIIHVHISSSRILPSQGNHSKYQAQYFQIIQLTFQIQLDRSRVAILLEDM